MNNPAQNNKKPRTAISPTREEDFAEWYQQVVRAADFAENSPTRGCMIIKPYGWAIWEKCQEIFDKWLKDYGVQNASFPLLIPMSFFSREAEHVEGFAKECAVVTHHRLESDGKGGLQPAADSKLEEPYIVRPTSETIIGDAMSRWIQSYRDLPMQLNQWAQVLRWEMRTRLFLRTAEFFWHEGHNAFADHEGADQDCRHVMGLYEKFFTEYLAFDGYIGLKTEEEKFPGANNTYAFEAMMQDGKALQAATTHDLGTTFSKTFNITYQGRDEKEHLCHTTSWAFSTRTIGGLIMMHADDDGMIMPPRIAPQQIIILPVVKDDTADAVEAFCAKLADDLKAKGFRVKLDNRDMRTPDKMWDAVKKGIPIRVEVGAREMEAGQLTYVRRDIGRDSKTTLSVDEFMNKAQSVLDDIHDSMLERTRQFRDENTYDVTNIAEIDAFFKSGKIGFVRAPVSILEDKALEKVMSDYSLSTRNMPIADHGEKVLIAKAY
ncbi:MAG: proline--tRNA ligase [Alphaproteobacteria bacterium]|nr:proline--tRNA ligase [Alphaproteobacteria bacterium]NCQ88082.1 proline--tRNA ligase [Alphaproteobacteria bacterium]NCT05411.1 proline--tRNA ligase [Alphaproteobacteria bacterium]